MGRPSGGDAAGESPDVNSTPPADAALPPLADIDSGAAYASPRHPASAIEATLARLALKETPRSPRSPSRRPPPDAAVLVLGFPDSLPPSGHAAAAAGHTDSASAPGSPSGRPLQRTGSGALFTSLQAAASPAPPAVAAPRPDAVVTPTADAPRGAGGLGTLSSRGAVAVAVPVPSSRHTAPGGAAAPEQATPPSPSPLSPLWTRAQTGSSSCGPGLARRASPEGATALPRALFGSVERSFLTGETCGSGVDVHRSPGPSTIIPCHVDARRNCLCAHRSHAAEASRRVACPPAWLQRRAGSARHRRLPLQKRTRQAAPPICSRELRSGTSGVPLVRQHGSFRC